MPLAIAVYQRKLVASAWSIAWTGNPDAVGSSYESEFNGSYRFKLRYPGWYLLVVQAETRGVETEIELLDHTADTINTLGRWKRGEFSQLDSVTVNTGGTVDPAYTTFNRLWMPYERVSMPFIFETTTPNEAVRFKIASGLSTTSQTFHATFWRFQNFNQPQTQSPNCCRLPPTALFGAAATLITPTDDLFVYYRIPRYRVTVGAGVGPQLRFGFIAGWSFTDAEVLHGFSYELVIKIVTSPGETATGTVTIGVYAASAGLINSGTQAYNTTEATYTRTFAARTLGDAISEIRISGLTTSDKFDIEVALNVTS